MKLSTIAFRIAVTAALVSLALVVAPTSTAAAPATAGETLVSGYVFSNSTAATQAANTGNYAGGRWVVRQKVLRYSGSIVYTAAGWVVPCIYHQSTARTLNTSSYTYSGWDTFWFQSLGQDTAPFWW